MAEWDDKYQQYKQSDWQPTELAPEEHEQYQKDVVKSKWFQETKKRHPEQSNEQVLQDQESMGHYDLKGAWKQGMFKQSDEHEANKYDNVHHLGDKGSQSGKMLKSPDHPTAWMEFFMEQHKKDPESLGLHTYEDAVNWQAEQDKQDYAHRIYPNNP